MSETAAYTISEFTRAYGIGRTKLYEELKAGRLRARKSGTKTIILAADARVWAENLPCYEPQTAA